MMSSSASSRGFTIVELLVVIVVIGILAAISLVAYNGITGQARVTSLQSDLRNAGSAVTLDRLSSNGAWSPSSLPSNAKASPGNVLQLTNYLTSDGEICINGARTQPLALMSWRSDGGLRDGLCPAVPVGDTVGGTMPTAPRGVNLNQGGLADWSKSSGTGISYDKAAKELVLTNGVSGTYLSPPIRVDGPRSVTLKLKARATIAAAYYAPEQVSGVYTGSLYYGSDGTTAVQNTSGYTSNGNAQRKPLNEWADYSVTVTAGSNVIYIRFTINSGTYTTDNHIKDVEVIANE